MKSEKFYNNKITLLSGGVGGAKLSIGMMQWVRPSRLHIIVNTADDAEFYGLNVSPDMDTMMYTLSGAVNPVTGWGIDKDTFYALSQFEKYGKDTWFKLGDRDLATHILRTELLREGKTLTEISRFLTRKMGLKVQILPMTDEKVRTMVKLDGKWLSFQDYFVKKKRKGRIDGLRFKGLQHALPTSQVIGVIQRSDIIVFAPSNPVVSILPILSLKGFKAVLNRSKGFKVAVSPFIGTRAFSGPAKELMEAVGYEGSALGLAKFYAGMIDLLVIDSFDANKMHAIKAMGIDVLVTGTVMKNISDKARLAKKILDTCNVK